MMDFFQEDEKKNITSEKKNDCGGEKCKNQLWENKSKDA